MEVVNVDSWHELQEALFADAWDDRIERYRARNAYRGLSDAAYPLHTTLMRLGGPYAQLEGHLLRSFRKYAHRSNVERDSLWHWLAVARHYGLPTRLLDWTQSPYVAMHFATAEIDKFDRDGVIWAVNYHEAHAAMPKLLQHYLDQEGANLFTVEILSKHLKTLKEFREISDDAYVIFFEPPSIDDRIVNQYAVFSTMPDPTTALDDWLGQAGAHMTRKIIIPAKLKWEVRDKLDQANITERVLFPGLDGLSRWLQRYYAPKE